MEKGRVGHSQGVGGRVRTGWRPPTLGGETHFVAGDFKSERDMKEVFMWRNVDKVIGI